VRAGPGSGSSRAPLQSVPLAGVAHRQNTGVPRWIRDVDPPHPLPTRRPSRCVIRFIGSGLVAPWPHRGPETPIQPNGRHHRPPRRAEPGTREHPRRGPKGTCGRRRPVGDRRRGQRRRPALPDARRRDDTDHRRGREVPGPRSRAVLDVHPGGDPVARRRVLVRARRSLRRGRRRRRRAQRSVRLHRREGPDAARGLRDDAGAGLVPQPGAQGPAQAQGCLRRGRRRPRAGRRGGDRS
jgi:hypothetical protein